MQLFRGGRSRNIDLLIRIFMVLGILLIIIAALFLLGSAFSLLHRFKSVILLFVLGAILAYLMESLARVLQRVLQKRWASVIGAYLLLFIALSVFAVLLLNPFVSQAQSLVNDLHDPSPASLHRLATVQRDAAAVNAAIRTQASSAVSTSGGSGPAPSTVNRIARLRREIAGLGAIRTKAGQTKFPSSYIAPLSSAAARLAADYPASGSVNLKLAQRDASKLSALARSTYAKASTTPILLLSLQVWLDKHGIKADLHDKFGRALQQLNSQLASIVNNALTVAVQAGNLLLNTVLTLIISIYLVTDGARLIRWMIGLVPVSSRPQARYFFDRLDQILGAYLRTQVILALIAASLAAVGALVLGVPYAVVIFFSSFLLSLVPVIGPVVLPIPPLVIALIFTSLPTAIIYLVWLLVAEQITTNIIGPRVQGQSVGIHPLEAMAAALLGFPIAGFLGAFFAVPIVAFLHVVVQELLHTRKIRLADEQEAAAAIHAAAASAAVAPKPETS
ncbi:MAG TPA: AI-2E family transporter [Chloroflexota bacterium]|nr:AI-2E family transporter [Chloroflexota bacterium]